jgi:hypothetical protein
MIGSEEILKGCAIGITVAALRPVRASTHATATHSTAGPSADTYARVTAAAVLSAVVVGLLDFLARIVTLVAI